MRVEGTFLKSRIARRTFLYFCAAALAPTILLSALALQAVKDTVRTAAQRDVVATSKALALSVFERMDTAALVLAGTARQFDRNGHDPEHAARSTLFVSVLPVSGFAPPVAAALHAEIKAADRPGPTAPDSPRTRVVVLPASTMQDRDPGVFLIHPMPSSGGDAPGWIAGQLRPRYLWGQSDEFLSGHRNCVFTERNERVFCSAAFPAEVGSTPSSTLDGAWTLFLKARFGAPSWTFRTTVPGPSLRSELPQLAYNLAWVWLGTLLLVILLSLLAIRRTMLPLEDLIAQTRRIPKGQYSPSRRGHDEFGQLSTAFDEMGLLVARQMGTLSALSELDRKILSGQDLREVIDLVLERIQQIIPDVIVCVLDRHSGGPQWADNHIRPAGTTVTRRSRVRRGDDLAGAAALPDDRAWVTLTPGGELAEPLATLAQLGARHGHASVLRIGARICGAVGVGLVDATRPAQDCLQEVHELGSRIAVAIAAREREDVLMRQARHDVLTGLSNRFAAQEAIAATIARPAALQRRFAVLFFDLDGFKSINDGLGHATGDRVLVWAAQLLAQNFSSADLVARLGGDEFLVVLGAAGDEDQALHLAARAIGALAQPIFIDGVELFIGVSVGVALYPDHGHDVETLIRNSDIAMYQAKRAGGGSAVLFEDRMNKDAADRIQLENDLRHAVQCGEIQVHFQPVVDIRTGRIVGAEALARWQHPTRGAVSPAVFIPVAEKSGLIIELGTVVLRTACREFAAWKRAGHSAETIAVNVSSRQLQSEDFVAVVAQVLAEHALCASDLEIEITESMLVENMEVSATRLDAVRRLGVSIAIDDFGTGYSSLAYLKSLPVDTLKIDREFIVDMTESDAALALVRAIVAMGHATGKTLVAEGIETKGQVELLRGLGCFKVQGFLFYRPMTALALGELLAMHRHAETSMPADAGR